MEQQNEVENKTTTTEPPIIYLTTNENNILDAQPPIIADTSNVVTITTDTATTAEPLLQTPKNEVKRSKPNEPAKVVIIDKVKNRISLTANFTAAEFEPIQKVIDWRIQNGLTTTNDHFVRQCIDFALCHGTLLQAYLKNIPNENIGLFAYPVDVKITALEKKGFFNK